MPPRSRLQLAGLDARACSGSTDGSHPGLLPLVPPVGEHVRVNIAATRRAANRPAGLVRRSPAVIEKKRRKHPLTLLGRGPTLLAFNVHSNIAVRRLRWRYGSRRAWRRCPVG